MNSAINQRIVYVEDDVELVKLVKMMLSLRGFEVTGVTEGERGFNVIKQKKPAVVLLDLMLPGMDGWEILRQLDGDEETRKIPVIIVSAKAQLVDRVRGLYVAQAKDYVSKPFQPSDLIEHIEQIIHTGSGLGSDANNFYI